MFGIFELEPKILELERRFRNKQNLENINELTDFCLFVFEQVKIELQTELNLLNDD